MEREQAVVPWEAALLAAVMAATGSKMMFFSTSV